MRGRRLLLNHTVQFGGSDQFSMMDGSPPLTTTPSPALAEAAARSNPHRRTPPSRSPRVPSSEAFGRRPHDRWIDLDGPASDTLHENSHRLARRAVMPISPQRLTLGDLAVRRTVRVDRR